MRGIREEGGVREIDNLMEGTMLAIQRRPPEVLFVRGKAKGAKKKDRHDGRPMLHYSSIFPFLNATTHQS